eukprot:gene6885-11048_t
MVVENYNPPKEKGMVLWEISFADATGHVDLWDGTKPGHSSYWHDRKVKRVVYWYL